jgi:hypothetical protein
MIEYIVLLFSIPMGILLARITKWEKNIYTKPQYFPTIVWVLAIFCAIFLTVDKVIGMSLLFTFLTVLVWWKEEMIVNIFKKL